MKWLDTKRELTAEDLVAVENEFNISLPEDYKSIIKGINGGALSAACILIDGVGEVSYSRNVPLNKEAKANIYDIGKYIMKKENILFPIAGDGFGNYFCLDLRNNTVVYWDHENDKSFYVCNSFTELIEKIEIK